MYMYTLVKKQNRLYHALVLLLSTLLIGVHKYQLVYTLLNILCLISSALLLL